MASQRVGTAPPDAALPTVILDAQTSHPMTGPSNNLNGKQTPDERSSSGLLRGIQEFRHDAWRRMFNLYAPLVHYWCCEAGLQSNDAEDVVQEVFRTVVARVGEFRLDGTPGAFRAWLKSITRHKLGDYFREHRRRCGLLGQIERLAEETPSSGTESALTPETRLLYRRATTLIRKECEERTWRAFKRVVMDGLPAKEVAEELGMSVNAVYLTRSRLLRRLRDELEGEVGPDA